MKLSYTYLTKGKYWRFRRDGYDVRLKGKPGEADFLLNYREAMRVVDCSREAYLNKINQDAERKRTRAQAARHKRTTASKNNLQGIIYFIGPKAGPVKIGFTTSVENRLHRLQMCSPKPIHVLAASRGARCDEVKLHRQFKAIRLHGEWFKRTTEISSLINEIGIQI